MAKKFFYVCAGLFLLAVAYAIGARSVRAQSGGSEWFIEGGSTLSGAYVVTASGESAGSCRGSCWSRAVGCRVVRDQLAPWERVRVTDDGHEQRQTMLFGGGDD